MQITTPNSTVHLIYCEADREYALQLASIIQEQGKEIQTWEGKKELEQGYLYENYRSNYDEVVIFFISEAFLQSLDCMYLSCAMLRERDITEVALAIRIATKQEDDIVPAIDKLFTFWNTIAKTYPNIETEARHILESLPSIMSEMEFSPALEWGRLKETGYKHLLDRLDISSEKVPPSNPPPPNPPPSSRDLSVAPRWHSDHFAQKDELGYAQYAKVIAEFILHKQTTPPLTVAVLAPWGQGKTSLMHYLKQEIESESQEQRDNEKAKQEPALLVQNEEQIIKLKQVKEWIEKGSTSLRSRNLPYPTVWFNAWKYQNSEQVWASLAQTIIKQLSEQLPNQWEREKFWLELQLCRIDRQAVQRDLHKLFIERFLPSLLVIILITALAVVLAVIYCTNQNIARYFSLSGGVSAIASWFWAKREVLDKAVEGTFEKYLRQPDYKSKAGYFAEVEEDLQHVFDLLVDKENPAVIFIDDLDRCAPDKVAALIEAINLFIGGDFPHCYFVLGMDAQVVAASLDVSYKDISDRLPHLSRSYGSMGWYFMEKFIQLPFVIPSMDDMLRQRLLSSFFSKRTASSQQATEQEKEQSTTQSQATPQPTKEQIALAAKRLEELTNQATIGRELLKKYQQEIQTVRENDSGEYKKFSDRVIEQASKQFNEDNPDVQEQLHRYLPYLGTSPRSIKRFMNLFRFYSLIQYSRDTEGLPSAEAAAVGLWVVMMIRYPQVTRWIQWESDSQNIENCHSPHQRADILQGLSALQKYEDWCNELEHRNLKDMEILKDRSLCLFLCSTLSDDLRLSQALEVGVW